MNLNFGNSPLAASMRPGVPPPSFLPDDYLRRKRERRSDFMALTLFCIVMFCVIAAFFVTNRQWNDVKAKQAMINAAYAAESKKIDELKVLEAQKQEMLEKAEITAALIERVPRSILLAEVINRMPEQLTLTDLKLTGKRIKEMPVVDPKAKAAAYKPRSLASSGGKNNEEKPPAPKPVPPKFEFTLELVGLAAADSNVADYHAALKDCALLEGVDLLYSGTVVLDDADRRKFRIEARIRPTADARNIQPLHIPRERTLADRAMLGPDGKPAPKSTYWMKQHGLIGARPAEVTAGEPPAATPSDAPAGPATADATPTQPDMPPASDAPNPGVNR